MNHFSLKENYDGIVVGQGTVLCPTVSQFRALARPLNGHRQGRGGAIDKRITDKTGNRPLS